MTDAHTAMAAALAPLPYPAARGPVAGDAPIYLTWFALSRSGAMHASDKHLRHETMMQVDVYSLLPVGQELDEVVLALVDADFYVSIVGAEMYDKDTGYHHVPITCRHYTNPT